MKALTTLLVVGMFATAVAMADDVDDVKAAFLDFYASLRSGDVDGYIKHFPASGATAFETEGGLLSASTLEELRRSRQAGASAGNNPDVQLRHMEVRVYGNTAVLTGYRVSPSDSSIARYTNVWVKEGGTWKRVHRHASLLRTPQ
jgi:ketosteroid isomerase-like protein